MMQEFTPFEFKSNGHCATVNLFTLGDGCCRHQETDAGGFEPETRAVWATLNRASDKNFAALDVGAYTGLYAIAAALMGKLSFAVEPVKQNMIRLSENAQVNNAKLICFPLAASDHEGTSRMFAPAKNALPSGAKLGTKSKGVPLPSIHTARLDDLIRVPIGAIKMDVERHEARAIAGMLRILKNDRPCVIVEMLGPDERARIESAMPDDYVFVRSMDRKNALYVPQELESDYS